jgi:hypothetical protein
MVQRGRTMPNRLNKDYFDKPQKLGDINRFFLACEFKPYSSLWSVLDPFAYDIKPAFIHGKLGIISYKPDSYAILETGLPNEPLLGYVMTITHSETILLLDKIKGYNGPKAYNAHLRQLVHAYTDVNKVVTAWGYVLGNSVLSYYSQIQQIEFGLWAEDKKQIDLLDKITRPD